VCHTLVVATMAWVRVILLELLSMIHVKADQHVTPMHAQLILFSEYCSYLIADTQKTCPGFYSGAPADYQQLSYQFVSSTARLMLNDTKLVLGPSNSLPFGPLMLSHLDNSNLTSGSPSAQMWTSMGYNLSDVANYLAAVQTTITHPNAMLDLR
jgi:hypothetical protein